MNSTSIAKEFLDYIGRDATKTMYRSFAQKGVEYENKPFPGKHRKGDELIEASKNGASIYYNICKFPPTFNGHTPGKKEEILAENVTWDLFVAEWDDGSTKEEQLEMIAEAGLPVPSCHVDTGGKSLHWYWLLDEEIKVPGTWEIIQELILKALPTSDQQIKDCTRVMRLPGFPHPATGRVAELVKGGETPARYSLEDFPDPEEERERQLKAIDAQVLKAVALQKHVKNSRLILENEDSDFVSALDYLAPYANEFNGSASWFTVMCAIRDAGDYLFLAHRFCEGMKDYDAEEIDRRWDNGDFDPKPDKITKATIFKLAAERGWKNPAIGRTSEYTQDSSKIASGGVQEPQRLFTDDIDRLLDLEFEERINDVIPLRKEIKKSHNVNDAKINASLMDAIRSRYSPVGERKSVKRRRSVRRSSIAKTVYLHDGLTPAASICMTDGPSSAGKSMFEVEKCIAVVEGRGCFDRDHPTKQGSVLFIATDSGANDFYATLDQLGYEHHPAILQGQLMEGDEGFVEGAASFFIWGESPEDGLAAWTATPANIARLIEFCRLNNVVYIVMDSVKTIMGPVGGYTDNQVVAQFMTMLKSTVCLSTGATICLINHDGVEDGAASGAKAWVENVTMRTRLEPLETADGKRSGTKAIVCKDRIGGNARSFGYKFGSNSAFELMDGAEMVSRVDESIASILWAFYLQKKPHARRQSIIEETRKLGIADQSVDNTLSQCDSGDLIRKKARGLYELTRNQLDAFDRAIIEGHA